MRAMMPSFASVVARCAVSPITTDDKPSSSIAEVMTPAGPIADCKPIPATHAHVGQPFDPSLTLVELAKTRLHDISDQDMIMGVGLLMDKLALKTQALPFIPTKFDAPVPLNVSITNFIGHVINSKLCSRECSVLALVYGQRLLAKYPSLTITTRNIHRLFLIALMLASKLIDDRYCRNNYYANIGGMDVAELNRLEMEFCFLIGFDLNVTLEEFSNVCDAFAHELRSSPMRLLATPPHLSVTSSPPFPHPVGLFSPHHLPPVAAPYEVEYASMCYGGPPALLKANPASLGWGNLAMDAAGYPMAPPGPPPHLAYPTNPLYAAPSSDAIRSMVPPLLAAGYMPYSGYPSCPAPVSAGYLSMEVPSALWLHHHHHPHHPTTWPLEA
eukprot:m.47706 g.47706  ORF g.47706 m.47706 type:complete len:385 (+) comp13241_c0_seq1:319-1473(+)